MSTNRINYPHAVLGNGDDILPSISKEDIAFSDIEYTDDGYLHFDITFDTHNVGILKLIEEGYAKYSIEIISKLCPLRLNIDSDSPTIHVKLKKDELGSDATIFPSIITVKEIESCDIPGINENFEGLPTGRSIAEFLAIYPKYNLSPKKPISSIMRFHQGTNFDKYPKYKFSSNNIEITLPPQMFKIYVNYNESNKDFNEIIISSIVVEALYQAFILIGKNQFLGSTWNKTLRIICGEISGFQDFDFQDPLAYPELINRMLKNHSKRLFESIENLIQRK